MQVHAGDCSLGAFVRELFIFVKVAPGTCLGLVKGYTVKVPRTPEV